LPASGKAGEEELCGTDKWAHSLPLVESKKAELVWVSVEYSEGEDEETIKVAKLWPRFKPWTVGLYLEDSTLNMLPAEFF